MTNKKTPEYLFHYTNKTAKQAIDKSGYIKKSTDTQRDAILGQGVYLTSMTPNNSSQSVLKNNYDGAAGKYPDNTQRHIRIATNSLDQSKLKRLPKGRDVWVYGDNINVKDSVPYDSNKVYK